MFEYLEIKLYYYNIPLYANSNEQLNIPGIIKIFKFGLLTCKKYDSVEKKKSKINGK